MIFAGTPFEKDKYLNSKIGIVPRKEAVFSILQNDDLDSSFIVPNTIYLRGAAYIFRFEKAHTILMLFDKYEGKFQYGILIGIFFRIYCK